jgi:2-desacetyl-2-hydroxyethyl bacteriochlorophyllide A dehydrogenase
VTATAERPMATAGNWPAGRMRTLQFDAPGQLGLAEVDIPGPLVGQILVRVAYVGICGTDVHLLSGHSAYVRSGLTHYPIRFGHEWAGEVLAVADDVDADLIGKTVVGEPFLSCGQCHVCRAGHYNLCPNRGEMGVRGATPGAGAEYLRVPAANVAAVPDGLPAPHALLAEPSVTVLHAYEQGQVQPGERVAVLGTGTIGLIAVQIGVAMGCRVDVIGRNEGGTAAARDFGAQRAFSPDDAPDDAYDVIFDATGSAAIGPLLTRIAAIAGRILEVGIPGRPVDGVDLAAFVSKGLSLQGILGGVHLLPRALSLIAAGAINPEALIDRVVSVSEAASAFGRTLGAGRAKPKLILDMATLTDAELIEVAS